MNTKAKIGITVDLVLLLNMPHLLDTIILVIDDLKENFKLENKCDYPYKSM